MLSELLPPPFSPPAASDLNCELQMSVGTALPQRMSKSDKMSEKKHIYIYIYTARWYVENYVRIMCQGWDHLKKVIFHSEMNLMLWLADLFILYLVNSITLKSKSVSNTFGALWQGNDKPFHYFMTCWVMSILIRQPWHSMRIFIKQI